MRAATSILASLILVLVTAPVVYAAADGDGAMTVSPTTVTAGATGQTFTFTFTNDGTTAFGAGSQVRLTIPAGWTAPSTTAGAAGYVTVAETAPNACNPTTPPTIAGTGPWTITITQTCGVNEQLTIV
jgi:hypothetical protein